MTPSDIDLFASGFSIAFRASCFRIFLSRIRIRACVVKIIIFYVTALQKGCQSDMLM